MNPSTLISCLLVLLFFLTCCSSVGEANETTRSNFKLANEFVTIEKYQKLFNKHYGSVLETVARVRILLARASRVFVSAVNYLRGKSGSFKEINHFSDRTREELAQLANKREVSLESERAPRRRKRDTAVAGRTRSKTKERNLKLNDLYESSDEQLTEELAESLERDLQMQAEPVVLETASDNDRRDEVFVDHRKCLSEARDQGYLGACYTFSSVALAEWMYCRDTGEKLLFSEQFILDCGYGYRSLEGGEGGFERDVGAFIGEFGLELRNNYPYNEAVNSCPYDRSSEPQKMGYLKVNNYTYREVALGDFESVLEETPIVASIDIGEQWFEYGGGVFENPGHDTEDAETHSTLIVGSGRQDGVEYWLVRNSHGANWGEGGYVKLDKSCPCIYLNRGYRSGARFGSGEGPRTRGKTAVGSEKNPQYEQRKAQTKGKRKSPAKKKKKKSHF